MVVLKKRAGRVAARFTSARNKFLLLTALALLASAAWLTNNNSNPATLSFYVASRDLPKGAELETASVTEVEMQLNAVGAKYLLANQASLDKWFLTRPVLAGELIPLSYLASTKEADCTPIFLTLDSRLPTGIKVGTSLDIWAAEQTSAIDSIPHQVALGAELIGVKVDTDGIGQSNQSIEVCISVAEVRSVVEAIAKKATVVAVRATE